jgi:PAS domain S-box-containing protein
MKRATRSMRKSLPQAVARAESVLLSVGATAVILRKSHEVRVGYEFCRSYGTYCGFCLVAANAGLRHGSALVAVCVAVASQRGLEVEIGFAHSFLLFYPTILIVALLAGFWAGVTATLLSALASLYFYSAALNSLIVSDERVGLTLFVYVGIAMSWLANSVRECANRLQEFEKVVEGLEEMIVVVDRDYRCLIANRAFLNYPGMKREDLIGRRIPEILNPGVFETTTKDKLDECFRGKIVQFEMRYLYPNRGERELVIAYFPIKGRHGVDRVACVLRDVTEQKEAEAALRESEDRYRDLVEHTEDLVCTHDLHGKLLSVNPALARLLDWRWRSCYFASRSCLCSTSRSRSCGNAITV